MMDHAEAAKTLAVEQYLLGELSEPEREAFEQHMFSCAECADAVETGTILTANTCAVFRETGFEGLRQATEAPKSWFSWAWLIGNPLPVGALAGVAVALVAVTGYQNLVQIPALRQAGDFSVAPAMAVRAARAAQELTYSKQQQVLSLTVAHEWDETFGRYQSVLERDGAAKPVFQAETTATPGDLTVSLRTSRLEAGSYRLLIYGLPNAAGARTEVASVPFRLTE